MVQTERIDSREEFFTQVFEDNVQIVFEIVPPQPEMWYRDGWPHKTEYIRGARLDRREIYNQDFRRMHWRIAREQLLYSHRDPETRAAGAPPRYKSNQIRTLLLAAEHDNFNYSHIYDATRDMARGMNDTPGKAIFLKNTGHSIHNERPRLLASEIADFVGDHRVAVSLVEASWMHAHDVSIEHPERLESVWRAGFYVRLQGRPGQHTWLHFAVPTPVIIDDQRLRVGSVMLRYQTRNSDAHIGAVHVYDGERRIAAHNNLAESAEAWRFQRFEVPDEPAVRWGLGISIQVTFDAGATGSNARWIEFSSVGCDFLA